MGGADSVDVRKEAKEMCEEDGGRIESPIKKVGERGRELVGGCVRTKVETFLGVADGLAHIVRTKSGITHVDAPMSPRPPWAMVMYAISMESWEMEVRHVKWARKELTMESIPTDRGSNQSFHHS